MKAFKITKYVFTIVGAVMLIASFFFYRNTCKFLEASIESQGIVIELLKSSSDNSTLYTPIIQFTNREGATIQFSSSIASSPPRYSVNERVKVFYNPKSPADAKIKSFMSIWGTTSIFGIIGSIFFSIGAVIFILNKRKSNILKHLKENGKEIKTTFQSVGINSSFNMNGRNPYIITSQWINPETSELHLFTSENIWFDPTNFIKNENIKVFIDKKNPKKYLVDLSFLPNVAR